MKIRMNWLVALPIVGLLCGCVTENYPLALTLNGKRKDRIYAKARKQELGGSPYSGTYSGEGVEDGFFYPARTTENGPYKITHTHISWFSKKVGTAEIKVFGHIPPPCETCRNTGVVDCDKCKQCGKCGNTRKVKEKCPKCDGKGYTRPWYKVGFKKDCPGCNEGMAEVDCPECTKCEKCDGTRKIPCPKCCND